MTVIKGDQQNRPQDEPEVETESPSTLLPMLISGLVLIVVSMIIVAIVA
jgi:hypothetical protein